MSLDDLEFELRKLPGVRAAGFDDRGDVLMVQLHLAPNGGRGGDELELPLPVAATRIAARHSDKPVAVEVVRWREAPAPAPDEGPRPHAEPENEGADATVTAITPQAAPPLPPGAVTSTTHAARPRLLAVLSFPDTDEVEVHLVLHGRRTIGRAAASGGLVAVVTATVEALRSFGIEVAVEPLWARHVEDDAGVPRLVAVALEEPGTSRQLFGVANGSSAIDSCARATLDALNRQITRGSSA